MRVENKQYLTYIAKYLGVALIAGSVVHIGTLDNGLTHYYIILAIIGLGLMIAGNIIEALENNQTINLKYFIIIIGLSFSTGFLSGGVQHFLDNPSYASWLLAIGLLVSYVTYFMKDKLRLRFKDIIIVAIVALAIIFSSQVLGDEFFERIHIGIEGENSPHSH